MEDGVKISELTQASTINDSDLIPIVQNDETKNIAKQDLVADKYSTNEIIIGRWIDNKPIYRKVINFGSLPDTTSKSVAHNIANIDFIVNVWGMAKRENAVNDVNFFPINESRPLNNIDAIGLFVTDTTIIIQTGVDRSNIPITYVMIEYTKTTD